MLTINLGYEYEKLKDYEKAIKYYSKCIELDTTYALAIRNRSFLYFKMKKYKKAIPDLKRSLSNSPNNKFLIYKLALSYDYTNQKLKALDYYNEYIKLKSEITDSTQYNNVIKRIAEISNE